MGLTISTVFNRLFGKKPIKIWLIGLGGAGKTTVLYKLKLGEIVTTIPTVGFNVETVEYKNFSFTFWDIGRSRRTRILARHYLPNTDVLVLVVNSSDRELIAEVQQELQDWLYEDDLKDSILLVFANKQDLPNSMSTTELTDILNLNTFRNRTWYVQGTSASSGKGLYEGLDWLCNELSK